MNRAIPAAVLVGLLLTPLKAQDKPAAKPSRGELLKAVKDDYQKLRTDFYSGVFAGRIKKDENGEYAGLKDSLKSLIGRCRDIALADPTDEIGLDALVYGLGDLGGGEAEADLYKLVLKHHADSGKIWLLAWQSTAPVDFLRELGQRASKADIRLQARYQLGANLYSAGKGKEAEKVLDELRLEPEAKSVGGNGAMLDVATDRLLFEIRRLNVGQEVPEVVGPDLDQKELKLSEYRGKVTLIVFWGTFCAPCMEMVPHEVKLVERYAGRPFAIVGVNGDLMAKKGSKIVGSDGTDLDSTRSVAEAVEKNKITWRSYRDGQFRGIGVDWNVRSWPTVYLIDHAGIIRGKWKNIPSEKAIDDAVEQYVKFAEEKVKPKE